MNQLKKTVLNFNDKDKIQATSMYYNHYQKCLSDWELNQTKKNDIVKKNVDPICEYEEKPGISAVTAKRLKILAVPCSIIIVIAYQLTLVMISNFFLNGGAWFVGLSGIILLFILIAMFYTKIDKMKEVKYIQKKSSKLNTITIEEKSHELPTIQISSTELQERKLTQCNLLALTKSREDVYSVVNSLQSAYASLINSMDKKRQLLTTMKQCKADGLYKNLYYLETTNLNINDTPLTSISSFKSHAIKWNQLAGLVDFPPIPENDLLNESEFFNSLIQIQRELSDFFAVDLESDSTYQMLKSQWTIENHVRNAAEIAAEQLNLAQRNEIINVKKLQLMKQTLDSQLRSELNTLLAEERAIQLQAKHSKKVNESLDEMKEDLAQINYKYTTY